MALITCLFTFLSDYYSTRREISFLMTIPHAGSLKLYASHKEYIMAAATLRKAKIDALPLSEVRPKTPFPRKKMSV